MSQVITRHLGHRLTLWLALQILLGLGTMSAAIYFYTASDIKSRQHESLINKRVLVEHALSEALQNHDNKLLNHRLGDIFLGHPDMALSLKESGGRMVFDNTAVLEPERGGIRVISFKVNHWADAEQPLQAALMLDVRADALFLQRQAVALLAATLVGTLVVSVSTYALVRLGLAPLRQLALQTASLAPGNLHQRLDGSRQPAELQPLVQQFNELLARLNRSQAQLEGFNADVAHELKTPLSTLIASTELALGDSSLPSAAKEQLGSNLEELQRITSIINDMLFVSQASKGASARRENIPSLAQLVADVLDYHDAAISEADLTAEISGDAQGRFDASLLKRAVSNLVSNATRYATPGSRLLIHIATDAENMITLATENHGADIPAQHLPRLFDRFYRADASRTGAALHHGLGLAIVEAIAHMHDGHVFAYSKDGTTRIGFALSRGVVH